MKIVISIALAAVIFVSLMFQSQSVLPSSGGKAVKQQRSSFGSISMFKNIIDSHIFPKNDYQALNYDEQIGVWISYIDLGEMMSDATAEQFREKISQAYKNIVSVCANTVYVHVRAFADAYYPSVMYPYTTSFGSTEPYDALEIMVEEAHKLGLSFHAWINPLRCQTEESFENMSDEYPLKKFYTEHFGEYINSADGSPFLWLDPGAEEVREYVADAAAEIVSRYDVDGIHIDDYFYPTTDEAFDKINFEKSGAQDLSKWRMSNTTKLVLQMNMSIKNIDPTVIFEISPQGNINNNYQQLYADVGSWCASPLICDCIIPQVYFSYGSTSPYLETIGKWSEMTSDSGVKLVIGLGVYKIAEETEFLETENIIAKQMTDAFSLENVSGVALYNYSTLFESDETLADKMSSEREAITACANSHTEKLSS